METSKLMRIVDLATAVIALSEQCSAPPWTVGESDRRCLRIFAAEPWRVRSPAQCGFSAEKRADVAEVFGGKSGEAQANAQLMALAREALPALARAVITLALEQQQQKNETAALSDGHLSETVPDVPLPHDLAAMRETSALDAFYTAIVNAFDDLFEAAGLMQYVSNRNANAITRLTSGDGLAGDARERRWEVLHAVVAVLDPCGDQQRMQQLPQQFRVESQARPKRQDFNDALPELVRAGLRGEPTQATDEEMEAELLTQLTGSTNPTEAQIQEARERVKNARIKNAE